MTANVPHNVAFVLGPPGSGKGTQCERIEKTFGYVHLSAGQLLRDERDSPNSEFGELIETHIKNGSIVPVEITCSLLERAMEKQRGAPGFLVDGFPRNENNYDGWNKQMDGKVNLQFVLFIECPVETCINRCLNRGQGRSDDNEESLKKRINTYNDQTKPIIDLYNKRGLVRRIDGCMNADQVFECVRKCFEEISQK